MPMRQQSDREIAGRTRRHVAMRFSQTLVQHFIIL
jgi:hypothetical protein